ncbi:MAG TPA: hypothetical protein VKR83_03140 [Ktedonobacteraceae bacterium]|nr:hypothetical protein [Ktedonobacteraceae bacterium]
MLVTTTAHLVSMTTMRRLITLITLMPLTALITMLLLMTLMATPACIYRNETGERQGKIVPPAGIFLREVEGETSVIRELFKLSRGICYIQFEPCLSDSKWPPDIPRFPFGQKRRKQIEEALVKETVLNDEVEGSEQRGGSLLEEMSGIPPLFELSYKDHTGPFLCNPRMAYQTNAH